MSEHTPGPWHCHFATAVAEQADGEWQDAIGITTVDESSFSKDGGRGDLIAFVPCDTHWEENARLIAAAPELLAICKEMAGILHAMSRVSPERWLQVIRKAEGKA